MAVKMVALNRNEAGEWVARKSIPADLRDVYKRHYGVGWEALFKAPADTPKAQAKALCAEWIAEVETRIATLRAAENGEGQPLTKLNAIALAGRWYLWFTGQHEADPGPAKHWEDLTNYFLWEVLHSHAPEEYHENPKADPHWEWAKEPDVREAVRPVVAELGRTASFLMSEGIALTPEANALFVDAVSDNLLLAFALLKQRAIGDYSPDDTPRAFPAYTEGFQAQQSGLDCWQLFEAFVAATSLAPSTVSRWRAVFLKLQKDFSDVSASSITEDQARKWIGNLTGPKRSAETVASVWIPAVRRVFSWGEREKHVRKNPFAGAKVEKPKKQRLRETEAFTPEEISMILSATLEYTAPKSTFEGAQRWVMWLCAYSGARAGEITQLRGADISKRDDFYVMTLTPEAGTIKTNEARTVPLHEHVIAQGFLRFVEAKGKGPLFSNPPRPRKVPIDPLKPPRPPAQTTRARLGAWVRELGVDDPAVSPTHGWRHTFKLLADRAGISEKMSDAITGHAPVNEARKYGRAPVQDMAEALKKFPRYQLTKGGNEKAAGEEA
ncbi:MAG: tyrosine-type recombinase/integrase [Xanthobacteraceae bacterium]